MPAVNRFDIQALYNMAFGYVALPFPLIKDPEGRNVANSFDELRADPERREATKNRLGMLGNEIRMPFEMRIPGKEWVMLPNEPIVSIKVFNDLELTTLNRGAKRGKVTEMGNLDNYVISIKGICINEESDDYPQEQIASLRRLVEACSVELRNKKTDSYNIRFANIRSFDNPGSAELPPNAESYSMELMSDEPFELEIIAQ